MNVRPIPQGLSQQLFELLDVEMNIAQSIEGDAHALLTAYNKQYPAYAHKLSIVLFGEQWVGVDFDADRSCWYNTNNRYATQNNFYDATVDALAVRLEIIPPFIDWLVAKNAGA